MNTRISPGAVYVIVVLVLLVLALAILANGMTKPVSRDEQMYLTGAVCMAQGKMIYRDFSYAAQMPYHPLLCAALFKLSGTSHYLLAGRLVSCVCDILVMLCIVGVYGRVFRDSTAIGLLFGLAAAILYVFNPLVDYANGYAWNHDVVILCVMLSFWLFVGIDFKRESKYLRISAIGALLTFATCMRITTALAELLFFVVLLSSPAGSLKQRLRNAHPFLVASVLVLIWPVWVIAQAPRAFYLNMVKIPMLYGQWLHEIGMVFDKFKLTYVCLTTPGYAVLILLAFYLWVVFLFVRGRLKIENSGIVLLAALLPLIFFVIALIPPTMWQQYLAVPVPFMVAGLAFPLWYLHKLFGKNETVRSLRIIAIPTAFCAALAVISYSGVFYRIPFALVPEKWTPMEMHKIAQDIVAKTKEPRRILTFAPLLALEGGGEIYNELSAGAIIYRIGDLLSDEERLITHTVGQKSLPEVLKNSPPAAVVLGVEMKRLEQPILESVVKPGWERKNYENGEAAYFRP